MTVASSALNFEVPTHQHPNADTAGVVPIARAHLHAAPDCLLSIAAQQSPKEQVVRLSAWPEPNLAVFKVVVGCLGKSTGRQQLDSEIICPGKLLRALDYFIIPETLWPLGLFVMKSMCQKWDLEANHIMETINNDYMAICKDRHNCQSEKTYYVCKRARGQTSGPTFRLLTTEDATTLCPFPEPLKERMKVLAQAAFLQIKFNPEDKLFVDRSCRRPWSFTIDVPSVLRSEI